MMKGNFIKYTAAVSLLFFVSCLSSPAQQVYPANWWTGMKISSLQLMIYQQGIGTHIPMYKLPATGSKIADGIILKGVHHVENPNYVFIDIVIEKTAKPGFRKLQFGPAATGVTINYELKARRPGN